MTFVIDIDDTLLVSEKYFCDKCGRVNYKNAHKILDELQYMNKLYDAGHTIILNTGRNWDCYKITKDQLKEMGAKYDELVMGKIQGIYIDRTQNISSVKQAYELTEER